MRVHPRFRDTQVRPNGSREALRDDTSPAMTSMEFDMSTNNSGGGRAIFIRILPRPRGCHRLFIIAGISRATTTGNRPRD
jgi:hypothetical protein